MTNTPSTSVFTTISFIFLLLCQNHRGSVEDERGPSSRLPDAEGDVCRSEGRREWRQRGCLNHIANDRQHPLSACRAPRLVPVSLTCSHMAVKPMLAVNPEDMGEKKWRSGRELRHIDCWLCVSNIKTTQFSIFFFKCFSRQRFRLLLVLLFSLTSHFLACHCALTN